MMILRNLPRSGGGDLAEKEAKQGCNVKQEVTREWLRVQGAWDMEVFIPDTQSCCLGLSVGTEGRNSPYTSLTSMQVTKAGSSSWGQVLAGVS